jgi:hypothetical protein
MTDVDPAQFVTPDPLPAEFAAEARAVDALLSESARMLRAATPAGLSQRVFDASMVAFDPEAREVDAMLARSAHVQAQAPQGLAQRVYQASVELLPALAASSSAAATPALRLVASDAPRAAVAAALWRWSIWQRLSLAASVAIVGGIAMWAVMLQPPAPQSPNDTNQPEARFAAEISSQFQSLNGLTDDLGDFEAEVAYLLDATEVRSVSDLNRDFTLLAQRMDL